MKKLLMFLLLFVLFVSSIFAEVFTTVNGEFLFRGKILDKGICIQPFFVAPVTDYFNFTTFWNYSTRADQMNEVDYIFDTTSKNQDGTISYDLGTWLYNFTGINQDRVEVYGQITFPKLFLNPQISYYYDAILMQSCYLNLELSYPIDFLDKFTFNINGMVGYTFYNFSVASMIWQLDYKPTDSLTISPVIQGQLKLNDQYINNWTWALMLSYKI